MRCDALRGRSNSVLQAIVRDKAAADEQLFEDQEDR